MNPEAIPAPAGVAIHPLRELIHGEIHSRPFDLVTPPARTSCLVMLSPREEIDSERIAFEALCDHFGVDAGLQQENFRSLDLGPLRVRWERHNEFSSWTFMIEESPAEPNQEPFSAMPVERLPEGWLQRLPGMLVGAIHVVLESRDQREREIGEIGTLFAPHNVVGSAVSGGDGMVWSDFQVHTDGFIRFLVRDVDLSKRQAGRLVQRLIDIETYRLLALLSWPLARSVGPEVSCMERRLNEVSEEMAALSEHFSDPGQQEALLASLSALAAEVERIGNRTSYRSQASRAYYQLVRKRFEELREVRIPGMLMLSEFLLRRLEPAMRTCESVCQRQQSLAERISRTSELLRTRVDVALERQNRDLLASMDRRAQLQLRLQETVEGLSVVVISYYLTGLVAYLLKGADVATGLPLPSDLAIGIAVPVVVVTVWLALRRMRRRIARSAEKDQG